MEHVFLGILGVNASPLNECSQHPLLPSLSLFFETCSLVSKFQQEIQTGVTVLVFLLPS